MKTHLFLKFCAVFASLVCGSHAFALDRVTLQLRWVPQYQFAGYYMAQEKGFYRAEGLEVKIIPGNGNRTQIVEEVMSKRADFGIGNSGLAIASLNGESVTVVANIFQRSAAVLVTKPGLEKSIGDLSLRNLALRSLKDNPELYAIFNRQGIAPANLPHVTSSNYSLEEFIHGEADAINAYLSNEPFLLSEKNIPYSLIDPADFGLDFYGDAIFTSTSFAQKNPELVKRFVRATIKGWAYALDNMQETVTLLHQGPAAGKSLGHLEYEAGIINKLVMSEYIPIGHVNPERWEKIAFIFKSLGLAPDNSALKPTFFFTSIVEQREKTFLVQVIASTSLLLLIVIMIGVWYRMLNRRLQKVIQEKTELLTLVQNMANHDQLTGLPNRRLIYDRIHSAIKRANRNQFGFALCLLDLNDFKRINDQFGHQVGDLVLQELAKRFDSVTRETDSVGRFGGDEFIIVLEEVTNDSELASYIARLAHRIGLPLQVGEQIFNMTFSHGTAFYPEDSREVDTLISIADKRMYEQKKSQK